MEEEGEACTPCESTEGKEAGSERYNNPVHTLALILLASALAACAPAHIVEDKRLDRNAVQDVLARTAAIRNLPLRRAIPVELVEKKTVRELFAAEATAQVPLETAHAYELLVKKLGLLPKDFDTEAYARKEMGQRVAGYYDPRSGAMRIVRRNANLGTLYTIAERLFQRDLAGEFLLAHELAHGLADQHFDLATYGNVVTNADVLLARRAFAEGDAMLTGFAYVAGRPLKPVAFEPTAPKTLQGPLDDWRAIPEVLRRPLLFLYLDGLLFASQVYVRDGTAGLDAGYSRPPRSTEEMLHPAKYFTQDDPPVHVAFEADPPGLRGLPIIDENTLGELGVQSLLIVPLGCGGAEVAAAGWGGDRFRIYRYPGEKKDIGFAWKSVWDTPADRDEFASNLGLALNKTFDIEPEMTADGALRWLTAEGVFTIANDRDNGALVTLTARPE